MSDEPLVPPEFVETFAASTTDLPEGDNLYYTDVRARDALSAGFGISYDNNTGVISYAGFGSDDTLLSVGLDNTNDLLDVGFVGKYVSAGAKYTGLFRDASDGKYKLYQGLTSAPTANVVDLTGGVLADLSVGNLSATSITGTLQTGSQPLITTLGGITTLRNIPVGANAIGDGSTALTGVLQTGSQPLITTLANVTSLNATPIGTNSIGNSATVLNGVLQTSAQPNITTLANVSNINSVPIAPNTIGDDTTALGGVLLTDHQPLIATLPSLSNFNGIPVSSNSLGNSSTALSGILQTGSQPNITTLSNTTNVNGIPISANSIGNSSTALNGVLQTAGQPNILLTEYNLTGLTDVTVANVSTTKHGLMPKLSGNATDMFLGNGTWGSISTETLPSLLLNGPTNAGDAVDIGFLGKYVLSGNKYTGLFRDATDGKYKLYHGLTVSPGSDVVNLTSGVLSELVLGTLTATNITGSLQTTSQPYITTLASVTGINSIPISANALGDASTALTGVIQTTSQPLITTLSGVTNINGVPISNNSVGNHNTALYGVLQTPSNPNTPTLAGVVSINSIPVGPNSLGSSATALTGILQTPLQPYLNILESNLSGFTDITTANANVAKHGLLPKLSGSSTDVLRGNGTWGAVVGGVIASLESLSIFGDNNLADLLDIGFLGTYTSAGTKYTGLFRDATDGKYKLYHGLTVAPSSGVVNLTSGILSELVLGTLTATNVSATNITGTLQTASQPNITTLASVTSLNGWTVGSGTLSGGSSISATNVTGTLTTASQPNITTLAGVTSINSIPVSSNALGNSSTALTGVIQTASQPNITTLAGVTSLNGWTVGSGTLSGGSSVSATNITGTLQTASQPNISVLETNLAGFTDITTANATSLKHGLLPKLSGVGTDVLKGDGTWGAPSGSTLPSLILPGPTNPADLLDIGFLGTYVSAGTKYTGMFRDATDGKYKLYHGLTVAPSSNVVDLTSGVLSELVVGTLTSTTLAGTLSTALQPNITTLAGVTSLNSITVGSGTLSGLSSISATSLTGTLATVSQPNITTLAGVTNINSIPVSSNALGNGLTALTGTLSTASQPNITTLAGVTSLNSIPVSSNALGNGSTSITGTLQTASQPNITTLAGVTSLNGWTVGSGTLSGGSSISATNITGTLQTASQPNITTLAGVTSLNNIVIGNNSINVTDLTVTNLVANGVATFVNSNNLSINDPLISLAANNTTTDVVDIGIFGTYASSGTKYTGLFRDATDSKWKIYDSLTALPTTTIDITTGVLGELVLGILSATTLTGTLSTASQPNITTLAGVTSLNGWTVGSGTLSGGSSVSATSITGTTLTGTLATASQPNITTLAGVTSLNGWTVGSGTLSGGSSISATNITGTLQTASQPNISVLETNLAGFTDVTTADSTSLKHGLLPKLSGVGTDVLKGDGTWGAPPSGAQPSLLLPGPTNPADLLDIGFLGTYVSAGTKYTGLFRDATDGKYKLYHGLTVAPTTDVVDLTSGVLSELLVGTLTATDLAGTLSTASQPNVTTLAGVTDLNGITVGSGTLSGLSSISATAITGTLATASQPNITTLAAVTSLNSIPVSSNALGNSSTAITGGTATLSTAVNVTQSANSGVTLATFRNSDAGTSAQAQISVVNDANIGIRFGVLSSTFTGTPNDAFISTSASSSDLTIRAGTGDGLFLNNNGYLCVGAVNPSNILQVGNAGRLRISNGTTDYSLLGTIDVDGATNTRVVVSGNTRASFPGQIDYVSTSTGGHLWYTGGTSLRMTLDSSGRLGIGITPTAKLHLSDSVAGANVQAIFQNTNAGVTAYNEFQLLNSGNLGIRFGITSPLYTGWLGDAFIYNSNNAGMAFGTNNVQRAYISATGNFGVGAFTNASAPLSRCHVQDDINNDTNLRVRNLNAGSSAFSSIYLANNGASFGALFLNSSTRSADGGTNTMTIRNDAGRLRLQASGSLGIELEASTGAMFTNSGRFELGQLGSGDRPAYVDFHASGAANALDFSARLLRNSGVNGALELTNTGSGDINLLNPGSGVYRFGAVSGGSGSSYVLNATSVADFVQTAGSHQIRQYVDTSGFAINGTIGNTALRFRTSNVDRMQIEGATPAVYFIGTDNTTYINYTASQATLIRCGTSSGFCSIGDNACTYVSVGNLTTPLYLGGISNQTYYRNVATVFFRMLTGSWALSSATARYTTAHGLGGLPTFVQASYVCTTADQNYAVGDRIPMSLDAQVGDHCNNLWFDATNIGLIFSAAPRIIAMNKTVNSVAALLTGSWSVEWRAFRAIT